MEQRTILEPGKEHTQLYRNGICFMIVGVTEFV